MHDLWTPGTPIDHLPPSEDPGYEFDCPLEYTFTAAPISQAFQIAGKTCQVFADVLVTYYIGARFHIFEEGDPFVPSVEHTAVSNIEAETHNQIFIPSIYPSYIVYSWQFTETSAPMFNPIRFYWIDPKGAYRIQMIMVKESPEIDVWYDFDDGHVSGRMKTGADWSDTPGAWLYYAYRLTDDTKVGIVNILYVMGSSCIIPIIAPLLGMMLFCGSPVIGKYKKKN